MIDWTKPETLRRRDNKDVRAKRVHSLPEWTKCAARHHVEWSDGRLFIYGEGGHSVLTKIYDVIPAPRSGEGWLNPMLAYPELHQTKCNERYIKIRWEEVTDGT